MVPFRRFAFTSILLVIMATGCAKKHAPASGAAGRRAPRPQIQPVEVTNITRRDLAETLNLVGSLAANESATIRPEIAGLVLNIYFDEGEPVPKGKLLAKINDAELQAQLAQSSARFQLAELNLQRAENLRRSQSNTQADVDRARSEHAAAKADLELLKVRLARTEIKAPFEGIVGSRAISPGDYVNTQSVVTTLDDLSRLKIEFQVPERFLAKVVAGTQFIVLSRTGEEGEHNIEKIAGEVYFVSSAIDRATRSSRVKGFLTKAPPRLRPGMFANVELILSVRKNALTVPEGAILSTPRGTQVIVVRSVGSDKVADFVNVKLGLRAKGVVEIEPLNGKIEDQQPVVASGVGALILYPGAKLELRPLKVQFSTGIVE